MEEHLCSREVGGGRNQAGVNEIVVGLQPRVPEELLSLSKNSHSSKNLTSSRATSLELYLVLVFSWRSQLIFLGW